MVKEPGFLGVLRVDSTFERPAGDVASLDSWEIPVKVITVKGSTVNEVVSTSNNYRQEFVDGWIKGADQLINEGAVAIVTSCGFLSAIHPILQKQFPKTPIGTSSLLQIPIANSLSEPGTRAGVITFDGDVLGHTHLKAVGAPLDTPIVGVEKGGSFDKFIRTSTPYDFKAHEESLVQAAKKLVTEHENIGSIILECANMPMHRKAVHEATGLPVYDIVTLGNFVYEVGLSRAFQ